MFQNLEPAIYSIFLLIDETEASLFKFTA